MSFFNLVSDTEYDVGERVPVGTNEYVIEHRLSQPSSLHRSYRALPDIAPDAPVFLKKLTTQRANSFIFRQQVQDSYRYFSAVREQLIAAGIPDIQYCDDAHLLMDLVPGDNLKAHVIADEITDKMTYLRDIFLSLVKPIEAIRVAGLAHRDIKGPNIMVCSGRERSATFVDLDMLAPTDNQPSCVSMVFGTFAYMSPEMLKGLPFGFHSDVYALGVAALEELDRLLDVRIVTTCTRPYSNQHTLSLLRQTDRWLDHDQWPKIHETLRRHPSAPDPRSVQQVLGLIYECLRFKPSDRPQDGATMRQILTDTGNIAEI